MATTAQLKRLTVLRNRLDRDRARDDTRHWVQDRRARTRHLIELGGLLQKAGLVELMDDDRATLLGALLNLAGQLRGNGDEDPSHLRARWRRHGLRVFAAERDAADAGHGQEQGQEGERMPGDNAALSSPENPAP